MQTIPIYQVDAFADAVFGGNPAAVCPLEDWLPDETLRAIAAENNLSETAFLIPGRGPVPLRWFTPRLEVKLCGHATLASAFVLFEHLEPDRDAVTFDSMSGPLTVTRRDGDDGGGLSMDFPAIRSVRLEDDAIPGVLLEALGTRPDEVRLTDDDWNYVVVFGDEQTVRGLEPDLRLVEDLHPYGLAVTAPAGSAEGPGTPVSVPNAPVTAPNASVDFVSRYFVPGYGIPEDPVTGSIHCALAPYWADRLGRDRLRAYQASERGGRLDLELGGDRVKLGGTAVTYMTGEIRLP